MRTRRGFTLLELVLAMSLLLIITGAAVQFLRRQGNLVARETTRMDALQNAQFAAAQIERELREAGAGVVDAQPMLVQLDSEAVTFNANLVSVDTGDVRAVYQLADADTNGTRGMYRSERLLLPNSTTASYPDTTYLSSTSAPSDAETVSYYFRPDSTTTLPRRYLLLRRVNALSPTLVARGIARYSGDSVPFFTYYKTDTLNRLVPISRTRLPLLHGLLHGAPTDTGASALTDSVRAVRVHFVALARDPRTGRDAPRTIETRVRLMNAGLLNRTSCGMPPLAPGAVTATSSSPNSPVKSVTIQWSNSVDDGGGEKDIERYALYRRLSTESGFGQPITSIPAAQKTSYQFVDTSVLANLTYVYGVAAQDCTPLLSGVVAAPAETVRP